MIQLVKRLRAGDWFAAGNGVVALVIGIAVFAGMPARPPWMVVLAVALIAALAASSATLIRREPSRWSDRITMVAGILLLAAGVGATAVVTLALTFARVIGGAGGGPGRFFFALTLLVVAPYMLIYPAGLLLWLGSRGRPQ